MKTNPGSDLLLRALTSPLPSARAGLTAVFRIAVPAFGVYNACAYVAEEETHDPYTNLSR
jgi:hypothetical protein